ncbi:MAG: hypothetical protein E5Y02_28585, partial [Mesorhizobium sp.]
MIILNVAIIEALLYDLHKRVKWFTHEGVMGMPANIITYIRGQQIDKLETLIASCRKHDLFDEPGSTFYDDLDLLRRIRNRVHLQNEKNDLEPDDSNAFSAERLALSERAVEFVMMTLEAKHPRPGNTYTQPFHLPSLLRGASPTRIFRKQGATAFGKPPMTLERLQWRSTSEWQLSDVGPRSRQTAHVKSFGRRQAYESPRGRNPRGTVDGY